MPTYKIKWVLKDTTHHVYEALEGNEEVEARTQKEAVEKFTIANPFKEWCSVTRIKTAQEIAEELKADQNA